MDLADDVMRLFTALFINEPIEMAEFEKLPREEKLRQIKVFTTHNKISNVAISELLVIKEAFAIDDFFLGRVRFPEACERCLFALFLNLKNHPEVIANCNKLIYKQHFIGTFRRDGSAIRGVCPAQDVQRQECTCWNLPSTIVIKRPIPVHPFHETDLWRQVAQRSYGNSVVLVPLDFSPDPSNPLLTSLRQIIKAIYYAHVGGM